MLFITHNHISLLSRSTWQLQRRYLPPRAQQKPDPKELQPLRLSRSQQMRTLPLWQKQPCPLQLRRKWLLAANWSRNRLQNLCRHAHLHHKVSMMWRLLLCWWRLLCRKVCPNVFGQRYVQLTSFSGDWQVEEKSGIEACRDIKRDQAPAEINKSSRCYGSSR